MEGYKNFIWCRYSKHLNDCGNYNLICEDENGKKLFSLGGTGYSKEHHANILEFGTGTTARR